MRTFQFSVPYASALSFLGFGHHIINATLSALSRGRICRYMLMSQDFGGEWGNVQRTPLVWLKLAQDKKVISWLSNSRHGAAVNVGKGRVSANCSVLCGQKYTKLMDDYHAVFQLGSTFVLVELPPYLHTTKSTLPTILVLVFDIVLVPSSEPSYIHTYKKVIAVIVPIL